jgi:hypothetical protein
MDALIDSDRGLAQGVMTLCGALFVAFALTTRPHFPRRVNGWNLIDWSLSLLLPLLAIIFATLAVISALFIGGEYQVASDGRVFAMLDQTRWALFLTLFHFFWQWLGTPLVEWWDQMHQRERETN